MLSGSAPAAEETSVLQLIQRLNQIPEEQLSDMTDPGFSILRSIYDQDGPDFLNVRTLLGKAEVRSKLNPSARCVLAGIVSQRWDSFSLSGNLYLAGLRSKNPDLRNKARKKLVLFIQPAHVPELINLLKVPGPNVLAYEILQEVTGKRLDPSVKVWQKWWKSQGGKADLVGHLLKDTRSRLQQIRVHPFAQEQFWYVPEGIKDAQVAFEKRPEQEQEKIIAWSNGPAAGARQHVADWSEAKDILDRVAHQPDPRVGAYLEKLVNDVGYGDYASVLLAWRNSRASLPILQVASRSWPTGGRLVARGSLGDRTALVDLMTLIERHQTQPLSYKIMDDETRNQLSVLRTVGVIPAEQAFELLCHRNFDFSSAYTSKDKKKAFKEAKAWWKENAESLTFDKRRGYFAPKDR